MEQRSYWRFEEYPQKGKLACLYARNLANPVIQELHISNTQYAILTSTKDIIKLSLILFSGVLTDRYGGASMYTYLALPYLLI